MQEQGTGLPSARTDRITVALARFIKIESVAGVLLLAATLVAILLSNSAWRAPFTAFWEIPIGLRFGALDFTRSLRHWVNDGLMTLFFFVVALELKRELVLGELRDWRRAALAFFAALGGLWASGGRPGTEGAGVASSRAVMASSKTRAGQRR